MYMNVMAPEMQSIRLVIVISHLRREREEASPVQHLGSSDWFQAHQPKLHVH